MWPPTEIPDTPNVKIRFRPSQNGRPLAMTLKPRLRMITIAAPSNPKIARTRRR